MDRRILRAYLKSLLLFAALIFLMVFIARYEEKYLSISKGMTIILLLWALPCHCWFFLEMTLEKSERTFKLAILTGFLSGIILALAVRMALALNYLLFSSDTKSGMLINIFGAHWQIYLWMGLFGIVCMSVEPFFRIVLHKDLLSHSILPSSFGRFWNKYSPGPLFWKFVLRRDWPMGDKTDLQNNDPRKK